MFKVMTWNVENLFRPGDPGGPGSRDVYEAKLQGLATTINAQAPDVLALQEVGDPDALGDLVDLLDGDWNRQLSSHPDGRGIRVVWLARPDITDADDIVTFPAHLHPVQSDDQEGTVGAMGRGAVAITVDLGGQPVRLVTTHLKSKLLTFPNGRFTPHDEDERARFAAYALYRRSAEAATLRVAVTAELAGAGGDHPLILTGDLNDTVQAATTQILLGPPGSEIGTVGFNRPDHGDAERLWNLAPLMPPGKDYSRVNAGRKELIDHIVVSAALVKRAGFVEAIVEQPLPSVGNDPGPRKNAPSSDHAPVVATFDA
ncbi:MAG TPA: endonuclease/exonuclease/phosphatase family protein [Candidatus Eisenbacteria bacterium]|nr:endonuclease/exonuclease/phosphatase family protein [Candidatus Eisenbacteria bacterium]